jgi:hypothetical protein
MVGVAAIEFSAIRQRLTASGAFAHAVAVIMALLTFGFFPAIRYGFTIHGTGASFNATTLTSGARTVLAAFALATAFAFAGAFAFLALAFLAFALAGASTRVALASVATVSAFALAATTLAILAFAIVALAVHKDVETVRVVVSSWLQSLQRREAVYWYSTVPPYVTETVLPSPLSVNFLLALEPSSGSVSLLLQR